MKNQHRQSIFLTLRSKHPILVSVVVAMALLVSAAMGVSWWIEKKFREQLDRTALVSCRDVQVHVFSSTVEMTGIQVVWANEKSDTSRIQCEKLRGSGISWAAFLLRNRLKIKTLRIDSADVDIKNANGGFNAKNGFSPKGISLREITIRDLILSKIKVNYTHADNGISKAEEINLHLHQLRFPLSQPPTALTYERFNLEILKASYSKEHGLYHWRCHSLKSNLKKQSLEIKDLELHPRYSEAEWKYHVPYRQSRIELKAPKVQVVGIDYLKLINDTELWAHSLVLDEANLEVVNDKEIPLCKDCIKPFVHEILLNAKLPIAVQKIQLLNNRIQFTEVQVKRDKRLEIVFDKIEGTLSNITNMPGLIKTNPVLAANLRTSVINEATLHTKIDFVLNRPDYSYQVEADVEKLNMANFNRVLTAAKNIVIKSGTLQKLHFAFQGNTTEAKGIMHFDYNNLKIEIRDPENYKEKKLLSALTNLIVKNDSECTGNKMGKIDFPTDRRRAIFYQWWGAVQSGIKSTILPDLVAGR